MHKILAIIIFAGFSRQLAAMGHTRALLEEKEEKKCQVKDQLSEAEIRAVERQFALLAERHQAALREEKQERECKERADKITATDIVLNVTEQKEVNKWLRIAAFHNDVTAVDDALACGADINAADVDGTTALMKAIHASPPMVEKLIYAGARIEQRDIRGWTAADYAADWITAGAKRSGTTWQIAAIFTKLVAFVGNVNHQKPESLAYKVKACPTKFQPQTSLDVLTLQRAGQAEYLERLDIKRQFFHAVEKSDIDRILAIALTYGHDRHVFNLSPVYFVMMSNHVTVLKMLLQNYQEETAYMSGLLNYALQTKRDLEIIRVIIETGTQFDGDPSITHVLQTSLEYDAAVKELVVSSQPLTEKQKEAQKQEKEAIEKAVYETLVESDLLITDLAQIVARYAGIS